MSVALDVLARGPPAFVVSRGMTNVVRDTLIREYRETLINRQLAADLLAQIFANGQEVREQIEIADQTLSDLKKFLDLNYDGWSVAEGVPDVAPFPQTIGVDGIASTEKMLADEGLIKPEERRT